MANKSETKFIEAIAYRYGTQNIGQQNALREVEARFETLREEESRRTTDRIKQLEAKTDTLVKRKTDADERWLQMKTSTDGREPEFAKPLLAVVIAFALIGADGQLLAPVMDGLNITDALAQLVVAIVLVTAFSVILKISVHIYRQPQRKLWLVLAPAVFSAIFGWWRGTEVVFASLQTDNSNTFASDNPTLTKLFVTLATIALPVGAALALEYGLEKLRHTNEWRKARRDHLKFSKALDRSQKFLEAAIEKRDHQREKLAQTRDEWLAAARQAHAEGERVGAYKESFSSLLLKIIPIGMLILAALLILSYVFVDRSLSEYILNDAARFGLYLLGALGQAGWYAQRAFRRWNRPSPEELYASRPTHFRNTSRPDSSKLGEEISDGRHQQKAKQGIGNGTTFETV
jgi:ABC-type nickel/cobalt efflux system permease component RcnA